MVAPGVGLCRGALRSRAAHRSRWSRPFHPLRITPATADTRRASCRAGQPTRPDSPAPTPPSHPQPPAAVLQKAPRPDSAATRSGQLPEGQPTAPRYMPSAGGQKRPPATTTPVFSCCRVGGCRAAGPEKAGPRHPLVAADAKDSPTTSTARHPFASPLKICRFINRQHGGFHAQANARSSSSARRGPSGNRCSSGYSGGAS